MVELQAFDGVPVEELRARAGAARLVVYDEVESTMDAAHELAQQGAPSGTVVLAEKQTAGRGRERREWVSPPTGVWMTLVCRGIHPEHLPLVPIRVGIALARALDGMAGQTVGLKWPNDLFVADDKLGGVLVEARWRDQIVDWTAIGIGVNVTPVEGMPSAGLAAGTTRAAAASVIMKAALAAAAQRGELNRDEITAFAHRDVARGRTIVAPEQGMVVGIARSGALLVEVAGRMKHIVSGSLVFSDAPTASS